MHDGCKFLSFKGKNDLTFLVFHTGDLCRTIHITGQVKWSLFMNSQAPILILIKKIKKKMLNLELVIMLEYQNLKIFLSKGYTPIWSQKVLYD